MIFNQFILWLISIPLILASGTIHRFDWNVSYVMANPDGIHPRRMIELIINGLIQLFVLRKMTK